MDTYKELSETILQEHREVFAAQDMQQYDAAVALIASYERIFVIGVGREGLAARSFAMRLMHVGKTVHWIWDDTTPGLQEDDLLIAVNGSSRIGHINYVIEQAKKSRCKVLVVTGSPSGKAASALADQVLFVPAMVFNGTDEVVSSIQPMGSLFEQHLFMLFDLMILDLEKRCKVSSEEMEKRHRNVE